MERIALRHPRSVQKGCGRNIPLNCWTRLVKYLPRIGIYAEPFYDICNQCVKVDRRHLQRCLTLKSNKLYNRCWEARCMGQK